MTADQYFERAEPLARKEREFFTRVKNAVMQFHIDCVLALKRREAEPKPSRLLGSVAEHQQVLTELTALNEAFLSQGGN